MGAPTRTRCVQHRRVIADTPPPKTKTAAAILLPLRLELRFEDWAGIK